MRDSLHNQTYLPMIGPVAVSDNTAQVSPWLNRTNASFEALTFGILTGILADTDANFTVLMEEADAVDQSDAAPVADYDMISQVDGVAPETAASFTFANDNVARKVGYIGHKAFVRITVTPSGNTGSALIAVFADCSHMHQLPAL
jgi:hypothetical protein